MAREQRNELSRSRIARIGERSVNGAFAGLLALTGEAVLVFDGSGTILLANDEAAHLFRSPEDGLVGTDVRRLFPPAGDLALGASDADSSVTLPFAKDGSSHSVSCQTAEGSSAEVTVRCDKVRAPGETYLLVAHVSEAGDVADRDHDRLVEELSRANKRLSGTLRIVLGTLGSQDVSTLFQNVLDEIRNTMEASGTIVYLAEGHGFHLRGVSEGLDARSVARYIPFGGSIDHLATREGTSLRLRVLPPTRESLRRGRVRMREVMDEETHQVHTIKASSLPPFASFVAVPVWFGGHVIAIIIVGWRDVHPTRREDAQLLDAVAEYLSVQLMGAFAALRAQRAERLDNLASELRERLMAAPDVSGDLVDGVMRTAVGELEATSVRLRKGDRAGELVAELPVQGTRDIPFSLAGLEGKEAGRVTPIAGDSDLARWLRDEGEPCMGVIVDVGEVAGERMAWLVLCPSGSEPLSGVESDFLDRVAQDMAEVATGEEARSRDKRIAQALQSGMRNELQKVEGITAQGLYSSATASAFVGGDFYDLIRLPDRRACVIMGDVSGKGVEAASVSAAVKTALGAYAWEGLTPARMVRSLNDFLLGFSRVETFATLFVGLIDLVGATITYCSAGHPPAIIMRARTQELESLDVQSGVVGAFHDMTYQDGVVPVEQGDMLVLYTDGTTEARDPEGDFFGEDGLRDMLVRECSRGFEGLTDRMIATLDRFTGNNLEDDVALVALRFDEVGRPGLQ